MPFFFLFVKSLKWRADFVSIAATCGGLVGFVAVLVNLAIAAIATLILRAAKVAEGVDGTAPDDYFADEGDPRIDKTKTAVETVSST